MSDENKDKLEPTIVQGTICRNGVGVLFIISQPEAQPLTWEGQSAGSAWVGTELLNGRPILCTEARIVAKNFKEYIERVAVRTGITHAKKALAERARA